MPVCATCCSPQYVQVQILAYTQILHLFDKGMHFDWSFCWSQGLGIGASPRCKIAERQKKVCLNLADTTLLSRCAKGRFGCSAVKDGFRGRLRPCPRPLLAGKAGGACRVHERNFFKLALMTAMYHVGAMFVWLM